MKSKLFYNLRFAFYSFSITIASLLIFGNIYSYLRISKIKNNFYRGHDKYSLPSKSKYKTNISSTEKMLFGDICHFAGYNNNKSICPFTEGIREYSFVTDKRGYKTLLSFEKANITIVGDSFLAALGGDNMSDQLGYVLSSITKHNFYEAAHPGKIKDYLRRVDELNKEKSNMKYIILIYEGNDLKEINSEVSAHKKLKHFFSPIYIPLIASLNRMPLYTLLRHYSSSSKSNSIKYDRFKISNKNGIKQAFNAIQSSRSEKDHGIPNINKFISRSKNICAVVHVPTAHSVYLTKNKLEYRHPQLIKDIKILKANGIEFFDLTKPFRALIKENPTLQLYWLDDTHWNKEGIKNAAILIKKNVQCVK
tara:strand:+ start:3539 stop:4633 length:1095 start_codon:yes stop_codon:yes gene_type:complete